MLDYSKLQKAGDGPEASFHREVQSWKKDLR